MSESTRKDAIRDDAIRNGTADTGAVNVETTAPRPVTKSEETAGERTRQGRTFAPASDIFETARDLTLVLDMPGVSRDSLHVRLEDDRLEIEGIVDVRPYAGREALYSEYNVGNFHRRFTLSNRVDRAGIEARLADGVLTLRLPKIPEAAPRRIPVQ